MAVTLEVNWLLSSFTVDLGINYKLQSLSKDVFEARTAFGMP